MRPIPKTYADLYLYGKSNYEKQWMEFLISSKILDKNSKAFEEIKFAISKIGGDVLLKTMNSDNVVFIYDNQGLPRSLKVFAAKDIKRGDKKVRVFIDISTVITISKEENVIFSLKRVDILAAYLISALVNLIYYSAPEKVICNHTLMSSGSLCFSKLVAHIIDYLRIGGVDKIREKVLYLSTLYYHTCILNFKNISESIEQLAKKNSGLTIRETEMVSMQLKDNTFNNIDTFISSLSELIKAPELKLDNFVEKWLFLYHSGTQFALELYPAFSTMITNAYSGTYLNNQKLIEKICGQTLVTYTRELLRIGGELR